MAGTMRVATRRPTSTFPLRDRVRLVSFAALPVRPFMFVGDIVKATAQVSGNDLGTMYGPNLERCVSVPRQVAMWIAYHGTEKSLPHIAVLFCRDHKTVCHAIRRVERRLKEQPKETAALICNILRVVSLSEPLNVKCA
jgi:hypothetical protein